MANNKLHLELLVFKKSKRFILLILLIIVKKLEKKVN